MGVMVCQCCECECERQERPEPGEHNIRFKRHEISVSKDSLSENWYIRVTHPNGCKVYGDARVYGATWQEAVKEEKRGAMLEKKP